MKAEQLGQIVRLINDSHSFVIISHVSPDGDTLGASFALYYALRAMGKAARITCADDMPALYAVMDKGRALEKPAALAGASFDAAIAVDCADEERMGEGIGPWRKAKATVNIDHHISNNNYAQYNLWDSSAAATGELIYGLLLALGATISKEIADCLYIALSTDTGNFAYSNTTPEALELAAQLLRHGVKPNELNEWLYRRRTISKTKLIAQTINALEMHCGGRVCVSVLTEEDIRRAGATDDECEGLIDYLREIDSVEIAILVREQDDMLKVGLRSKTFADMTALAEEFGGGGHKHAAGFTLKSPLEDGRRRVLKAAEAALGA